jgi:chromate reductase
MKKIIVFTASTNPHSINRELLRPAVSYFNNERIHVVELKDIEVPVYSECLENSAGIPDQIYTLYRSFSQADAFIFSTPEHNGLLPAFFKNVIDWMSRINQTIFFNKPVFVLSTSPGANGGATSVNILKQVLPFWGAKPVFTYSLGYFHKNFDVENGRIVNESDRERFRQLLHEFQSSLSIPVELSAN